MYASSCFVFRSRVSPRRATYFLLLRQKKVGKEKATLLSASLRFATGNLRCSTPEGVRRTRSTALRSNSCGPDPSYVCAPRRSQKGLGSRTGLRCARPSNIQQPNSTTAGAQRLRWPRGRAKQRPVWFPRPSVCAEERRVSRIRARSCLSEASSADPVYVEHRRLPEAKRRDADSRVAFSLATFFWRSKRK